MGIVAHTQSSSIIPRNQWSSEADWKRLRHLDLDPDADPDNFYTVDGVTFRHHQPPTDAELWAESVLLTHELAQRIFHAHGTREEMLTIDGERVPVPTWIRGRLAAIKAEQTKRTKAQRDAA